MITKPINFEDMELLERIRIKQGHRLSSHAFISLYLWREQMGLSLYLKEDVYSVKCEWKGKNSWFFPCGDFQGKYELVERLMQQQESLLIYLRPEDKEWLERNFPGRWKFRRDCDADEYLYDIEQQIELSGKKYANERTQVHKVERELKITTRELTDENEADAIQVLKEWSRGEHRFEGCSLRDELVDLNAITYRKQLKIQGILLYLDGCPIALIAGFALSEETFDIVVAKATVGLQGVSYYSKREMMKRMKEQFKYINLEEDLGLEGLRTMKQLMSPVSKNLIWEATLV